MPGDQRTASSTSVPRSVLFDLLGDDELVARNRPFLLAHPRLLEQFPAEITAMVDELIEPLVAATAAARADAGLDPDEASDGGLLIYHLVFGLLIDHAAQRQPPTPARSPP